MSDMIDLLPCPFCHDPMERWGGDTVRHTDFDAKCPIVMQGFMVAQWNRRAALPPAQDAVEALVKDAARAARNVYQDYGSKAREAIDYMEQHALAAIRKGSMP